MRPFWGLLIGSLLGLVAVTRGLPSVPSRRLNAEEVRLKKFIDSAEVELLKNAEESTFIEWAYASNITDHNEKIKVEQQVQQHGFRQIFPLTS